MSGGNKKLPLKRRFISLEQKLQILDRLENKERVSYVSKTSGLNEATIRTIQKNESKIRASVAAGGSISANMTSRHRATIIEKMEKELNIWIGECSKKQIALDTNIIKDKALEIYNRLKQSGESPTNPDFVASKGWYHRFRKRFSLQNLKIQESASIETQITETSPKESQKMIEQRLDLPEETKRIILNDKIEPDFKSEPKNLNKNDSPDLLVSKEDGFDNMTVEDLLVQELLVEEETDEEKINKKKEHKDFTLKSIKTGLDLAEQLELYFLNEDPSRERSTKFKTELYKCLAPYKEIYKDLSDRSRQSKITDFFRKVENKSSVAKRVRKY